MSKTVIEVKPVTLEIVRSVVEDILSGSIPLDEYSQGSWCGTSRCVWGHAWTRAGNSRELFEQQSTEAPYDHASGIAELKRFEARGLLERSLVEQMTRVSVDALLVMRDLLKKRGS